MTLFGTTPPTAEWLLGKLPPCLAMVLIDCRAAEKIRLLINKVHNAAGHVEVAFLLSGLPPTVERPARIQDVQPMDSLSSMSNVDITPQALSYLLRRLDLSAGRV